MASMQLKRNSMRTAAKSGFHTHDTARAILRRKMDAYVKDYYKTYFNAPDDLINKYDIYNDASITTNCQDVDKAELGSRLTTDKLKPTKFDITALDAVPVNHNQYQGDIIVTVMANVSGDGNAYMCNQVLHLSPAGTSGDYDIEDDMLLRFA